MSITGAYTWEDISSLGMEAYFQPIYNVEKHRITGLEALFRAKGREVSSTRRALCRRQRNTAGCMRSTCG
jgi:EAL domain-containing protein (putative c-di-GMP-specific phosphodiesterase class I)